MRAGAAANEFSLGFIVSSFVSWVHTRRQDEMDRPDVTCGRDFFRVTLSFGASIGKRGMGDWGWRVVPAARNKPAPVAHDQARERVRDFDVEAKSPILAR